MKVFGLKACFWLAEPPQTAKAALSWKSTFCSWLPKDESRPFLMRITGSLKRLIGYQNKYLLFADFQVMVKNWWLKWLLNKPSLSASKICSSGKLGSRWDAQPPGIRLPTCPVTFPELLGKRDALFFERMLKTAYKLPSFNMRYLPAVVFYKV